MDAAFMLHGCCIDASYSFHRCFSNLFLFFFFQARPWLQAYKEGKKEDYSDLQAAGTTGPETVRKNGQQIEDFITQCSFDSLTCEVDDFYTWQNDVYGNCFTFNHIKKPTKTTVREGSQYGLKLALFVDQDDYVGLLSPASGVRVSIHSR